MIIQLQNSELLTQEYFCHQIQLTATHNVNDLMFKEKTPRHRRQIRCPVRYTPSNYTCKRRRAIQPPTPNGINFNALPVEIREIILTFAIANSILMINVLRQVSKTVRDILDRCITHMERIYLNEYAMDALYGNRVLPVGYRSIFTIRSICKKCGCTSGLFLRLKEILKKSTSKWFNAYIVIQYEGDEYNGWFRIVDVYFKK